MRAAARGCAAGGGGGARAVRLPVLPSRSALPLRLSGSWSAGSAQAAAGAPLRPAAGCCLLLLTMGVMATRCLSLRQRWPAPSELAGCNRRRWRCRRRQRARRGRCGRGRRRLARLQCDGRSLERRRWPRAQQTRRERQAERRRSRRRGRAPPPVRRAPPRTAGSAPAQPAPAGSTTRTPVTTSPLSGIPPMNRHSSAVV